jgi:hypothetical protein
LARRVGLRGHMTPEQMDALVRMAGLEATREKFPVDVAEAAAVAEQIRAALPSLPGPHPGVSGEPWPAPLEEDGE